MNELPGAFMSIISFFIKEIIILSIQLASLVAASGIFSTSTPFSL
jgi:hypothetical protein